MAVTQKVKSEEKALFRSHKTMPHENLAVKDIIFNERDLCIIDPIDFKRISKVPTNSLSVSSVVKAGIVFFATVGSYYLAKTTGIFPHFGWGEKNPNLKDIGNSEIVKVKNRENALSVRTNLETARQANSPSVNRIEQTYKDKDSNVKFKERKVEEFENLPKVEENKGMQRFFNRRSISVQNPIPDQNVIVEKPFNLTIDGTSVFSSSGSLFLEATNIPVWLTSSYCNPKLVGSYDTPDKAWGVVLSGNYAYVTDQSSGLQIIDITDPSNPTFKGSYDTPDEAKGIALSGNYAYVADRSSGLQIIDITDPSNPTFKGSYDTPSFSWGVVLSGNYAYVTAPGSGLQIIDISDPSNPTFKGAYNAGEAQGVAVSGNYAYVADYCSFGLQIIDISDPSNPIFKGLYNTPGIPWEVVLSENYAYLTDYQGLQIIDISDPSNPTFKGSYDTPGTTRGIAVSGNYAYVADRNSGLQIIDISDLSNPTFKSSYNTPDRAWGVALLGNYAYVADMDSGLQIIASNLDKLRLSGIPSSVGTYSVDIEACNEEMECATDSFDIIVRDIDDTTDTVSDTVDTIDDTMDTLDIVDTTDTTDTISVTGTTDLTNSIVIISSMTVAACVACITSFSLPLIIGGVILMIRRNSNKILGSESSTKEKELQKLDTGDDKKIIVDK